MILFIDSYDSFSYILLDYLKQLGFETVVFRNDEVDWDWLHHHEPQAIVLSPGPGTPSHSGDLFKIIDSYHQALPILGICLGHQAIGQYFGARLVQNKEPVHGIPHEILHFGHPTFKGMNSPFRAMRYHSLMLEDIPDNLEVICKTPTGEVMGVAHKSLPLIGLQFHPESVLTENGLQMLRNCIGKGILAG